MVINVDRVPHSGALVLSTIHGGHFVSKTFYGYTRTQAKQIFIDQLKNRGQKMSIELKIVELDFDGREPNTFEITQTGEEFAFDPPVFESQDLMECVKYCYDLGVNFAVYTLAAWNREHN